MDPDLEPTPSSVTLTMQKNSLSYNLPADTLSLVLKIYFFAKIMCQHFFCCKHYFSPHNTIMRKRKDPDPDPYLWLKDSDPAGQKTSGSGPLTLLLLREGRRMVQEEKWHSETGFHHPEPHCLWNTLNPDPDPVYNLRKLRNADQLHIPAHNYATLKRMPIFNFPSIWNAFRPEKIIQGDIGYTRKRLHWFIEHMKNALLSNMNSVLYPPSPLPPPPPPPSQY